MVGELLKYLVCSWDVYGQVYKFGEHLLEIKVDDIFFLIGLSMRGAPISLLGGKSGGQHLLEIKVDDIYFLIGLSYL